jgi:hypothetical protein
VRHATSYTPLDQPIDGLGCNPLGNRQNRLELNDRPAMARDYHSLALQRAVDELGKLVLGFYDAVFAHDDENSYLVAILQAAARRSH